LAKGTWFGDEARVFSLGFGLSADLDDTLAALTAALKETALLNGAKLGRRRAHCRRSGAVF
jgi:hypothetical protein